MAEEEGNARRQLEAKRAEAELAVIRSLPSEIRIGQVLGFVLSCLFLGAGTWCILAGHDWAGATIAGGGLATVLGVFLYRRTRPDDVVSVDEEA